MNSILKKKASIWCNRLSKLMKDNGYTQQTFLKEYKDKYDGGTQANVSRWLRVGNTIKKGDVVKTIGFPSYENMANIAEFFGVTIGYLTGETDYESFEMEKSCQFLGIDEETCKSIKNVVSGKANRFHLASEYGAVIKYLFTANEFPIFVEKVREYAENIYRQSHPIDNIKIVQKKFKKDIVDLAVQCLNYDDYGEIDDFKDNNIEPTSELLEAIHMLRDAIEKNMANEKANELMVKVSEYELQKIYFDLLKEIIREEHLLDMIIPYVGEENLI